MGTEIEGMVMSLLRCVTSSSNDNSAVEIGNSLYKFGCNNPILVLNVTHAYIVQNSKLSSADRSAVLNIIGKIVQKSSTLSKLNIQQIQLMVNLATQEMTLSKDVTEDNAGAARDLLVGLARHDAYVGHVMEALLLKFPPGTNSPQKSVILTIGAVAEFNAFGFVPFLTDVLSRTKPILSYIRHDPIRISWCRALCSFCESLVEFSSNNHSHNSENEDDETSQLNIDEALQQKYGDQFEGIYDDVYGWMSSRDSKCRAAVVECIGALSFIVSKEKLSKNFRKIVTTFLSIQKKTNSSEENFMIVKGIGNFLQSACSDEILPVDAYLDDIFNSIFNHVCTAPEHNSTDSTDLTNQLTIKVRNEAFRCFIVACRRFADKIVYYLLHKLQSDKDSMKLGATNLLRHLLNSAGSDMEDKRSLITMGLKPLLIDENLAPRVKMGVCQLCVALADHGYVSIEGGGRHVVQFLTKNLIPSEEQTSGIGNSSATDAEVQLHSQCAKALHTIAKTCESSYDLLWPYLFEFFCMESYIPVIVDLCRCLCVLIEQKQSADEKLVIEVENLNNPRVPGPQQVLARLLVCLNHSPLNAENEKRARQAVRLLSALSSWFHESLTEILPAEMNKLLHLLSEFSASESGDKSQNGTADYDSLEQKSAKIQSWQTHVLEALGVCIHAVMDGPWREGLAAALTQQLRLYTNFPYDKAFALRLIGFCLARVANTAFVVEHLMLVFRAVNHSNHVERMGCAVCVGHCAEEHANIMLTELENIAKWEHKKSSSGFLSYIMPYGKGTDADVINLRATIILSYGYVVLYCPVDLVVQQLEKTVLPFLRQYLAGFKADPVVREAHLDAINLIATAVHPNHLNSEYKFESRFECFSYLKQYVKSEAVDSLSTCVRLFAAKAAASLACLDPPLSDNELWDVGTVLTQSIFPIRKEKSGLNAFDAEFASILLENYLNSPVSLPPLSAKMDGDISTTLMDATFHQYRLALTQIITKKPVVQTISQLLKMYQPFYGSQHDHERLRAAESTALTLQIYMENAVDITLGHAREFPPLCSILGRLAPRLADSLSSVRAASIRAIWLAFRLSLIHGGLSPQEPDLLNAEIFDLPQFVERYLDIDGKLDSHKSRLCIAAISKEINLHLPKSHLATFISVLFKLITDKQTNVASAAAQLLNSTLELRSHLLTTEAELLFRTIIEHLPKVHSYVLTYTDLLSACQIMCTHHQAVSLNVLLAQPLPYSQQILDLWQILGRNNAQFLSISDYILDVLGFIVTDSSEQNIDPKVQVELFDIVSTGPGSNIKLVLGRTCALVVAINELIKSGEPEAALIVRIPYFLSALLAILFGIVDANYPSIETDAVNSATVVTAELRRVTISPVNLVINALRTVTNRLNLDQVCESMNTSRSWTSLSHPQTCFSGVTVFCRALCDVRPDLTSQMISVLIAQVKPDSPTSWRVATSCVISALITRCPGDNGQFNLENLRKIFEAVDVLLEDPEIPVKRMALRSCSYVGALRDICSNSNGGTVLFKELADRAFDAAVCGLDDPADHREELALESVTTLDSLAPLLEKAVIEGQLAKMLLRVKSCFEKDNSPTLRSVSFSLFGKLTNRVGQTDLFRENVHSNIVSILLHLNDVDDEVRKCCGFALIELSAAFTSPYVVTLIQNEIPENGIPSDYNQFCHDFAAVLITSFPDRANYYVLNCLNYFKSQSIRIRSNAASLAAFILDSLSPELWAIVSTDLVFSGFDQLLRDSSVDVRVATAAAIATLTKLP